MLCVLASTKFSSVVLNLVLNLVDSWSTAVITINNICYTFNIVQNKQVISKLSSNLIGKFCLNVNNHNLPCNKIYLEKRLFGY